MRAFFAYFGSMKQFFNFFHKKYRRAYNFEAANLNLCLSDSLGQEDDFEKKVFKNPSTFC